MKLGTLGDAAGSCPDRASIQARFALATGFLLAVSLLFAATPASAALTPVGWQGAPNGAQAPPGTGFNNPVSVAVNDPAVADGALDPYGNPAEGYVYVLERIGNSVQVLGPDGQFLYVLGNGVNQTAPTAKICPRPGNPGDVCKAATSGTDRGAFNQPNEIAIDQSDGSIYVGENNNRRVQKLTAAGEFVYMIGNDVNQTDSTAKVCPRPGNPDDVCKGGLAGDKGADFGNNPNLRLSVDPTTRNLVVGDSGNRRISEFTPDGEFVRALGWDVVEPGGEGAVETNEIQQVRIKAGAGTFTLTFGGNTTASIPFDASAAQVEAALEALASIDDVDVTGGPGSVDGSSPYQIEFRGNLSGTNLPPIGVNTSNLSVAAGMELDCESTLGNPIILSHQWLRDGEPIPGATESTYTLTAADSGRTVQCMIKGTGEDTPSTTFFPAWGTSNAVFVAPLPTPLPPTHPTNSASIPVSSPLRIGGPGGNVLGPCNVIGGYPGATSLEYRWYMDGEPMGHTDPTYTVKASDLFAAHSVQCLIIGINSGGRSAKMTNATTWGDGYGALNIRAEVPVNLATVSVVQEGGGLEICTKVEECKAASPVNSGSEPGHFANQQPTSVAADGEGGIYAVESNERRVIKLTVDGSTLKADLWGPPAVGDERPVVARVAPDGNVWLTWIQPQNPSCEESTSVPSEYIVRELEPDGDPIERHLECARFANLTDIAFETSDGGLVLPVTNLRGTATHRVFFAGEDNDTSAAITALEPIKLSLGARADITPNSLPGYPNPPQVFYEVEYRQQGSPTWQKLPAVRALAGGNATHSVREMIPDLRAKTAYEVRYRTHKEFGGAEVFSGVATATTNPAPPAIIGTSTANISAEGGDLRAVIDPRGTDTTYYFEWGSTTQYGNKTAIRDLGDGHGEFAVSETLTGLDGGTYHFRVVAENAHGTVFSKNQTFNFYPQTCPNELVRQQTKAQFLPDCRAYELVSPGNAGGMVIFPSNGAVTGKASPSRLSWSGTFGIAPGAEGVINTWGDLYVSSRSTEGWHTSYVGLPVTETVYSGPRPGKKPPTGGGISTSVYPFGMQRDVLTNESMSLFGVWKRGNQGIAGNTTWENAPYLYSADGKRVGRLPTNLAEVEGGGQFRGDMIASADLQHFVFSSDIPFTEDGLPGDIYDNDVAAGTLVPISRDENGDPFSGSPVAASRDGSRILMTAAPIPACVTRADCPPIPQAPLLMREGAKTIAVSQGHDARFAGMTDDASVVYFTSEQQVTADDTDTSTDIFVWRASEPAKVERVSVGIGGTGNTDACASVDDWAEKCAAVPVSQWKNSCGPASTSLCSEFPRFFSDYAWTPGGRGGNGYSDNFVAEASGDIYFLTPETLRGDGNGLADYQNLHVYRNGEVRFVARISPERDCTTISGQTYCAENGIARMQVTPNGRYAAFVTKTRLTPADNGGHATMYRYDAVEDVIECASCAPDGTPPVDKVYGSTNGRYITDDGRTFFTTESSLVPQDTNEGRDVYEFVDGRPQLITQGTGRKVTEVGLLGWETIDALVSVSRDGVDAFFSTTDVLVREDHNGGNLKLYDARVNGGFRADEEPSRCEAADECRGDVSRPAATPVEGTSVNLRERGNYRGEPADRCAPMTRKARRLQKRARAAAKGARKARGTRAAAKRRRAARRLRSQARRASAKAKRCRAGASRVASGRGARR